MFNTGSSLVFLSLLWCILNCRVLSLLICIGLNSHVGNYSCPEYGLFYYMGLETYFRGLIDIISLFRLTITS